MWLAVELFNVDNPIMSQVSCTEVKSLGVNIKSEVQVYAANES